METRTSFNIAAVAIIACMIMVPMTYFLGKRDGRYDMNSELVSAHMAGELVFVNGQFARLVKKLPKETCGDCHK